MTDFHKVLAKTVSLYHFLSHQLYQRTSTHVTTSLRDYWPVCVISCGRDEAASKTEAAGAAASRSLLAEEAAKNYTAGASPLSRRVLSLSS